MAINMTVLMDDFAVAGITNLPPMRIGGDGSYEFLDSATPQAAKDAIIAVIAAHNPNRVLPDVDAVRDAYVAAKAAIQALAADGTVPATVRQAVVKLGLCVEALLIFLKRRIA